MPEIAYFQQYVAIHALDPRPRLAECIQQRVAQGTGSEPVLRFLRSQLVNLSVGDQLPVAENADAITRQLNLRKQVRVQKNGRASLRFFLQQVANLAPAYGI